MPTPSAIITASVGAKSAMSNSADAASTSPMARAIEANATMRASAPLPHFTGPGKRVERFT